MSKTYTELKAAIVVIHGLIDSLKNVYDEDEFWEVMKSRDDAFATLFKFAGIEEKKDEENG